MRWLGANADEIGCLHVVGAAENCLHGPIALVINDSVEDQGERPGRRGAVQVAGERCLGLLDKGVGLRRSQSALDRHHSLCRYVAGADGKHRAAFLSENRVDVTDQEPAARVASLQLGQVPVEARGGQIAVAVEIGEQQSDLGQAQVRGPQHPDEPGSADLAESVAATTVGWIDVDGPEQADLVIDPQRLRRQPCLASEFADGEHLSRRGRHVADHPSSPKGTIKAKAGRAAPVPDGSQGNSDTPGLQRPELLRVLRSAAKLQEVVPDAVLVGGSAAALWADHRFSSDHSHVVKDLAERFDTVLEAIESTDGWVTNRVTPGKIILGELGDIESGVRQLIRKEPLEVVEIVLPSGQKLCVPSPDETLRIKGYLAVRRNQVRDYLDVAALSDRYGISHAAEVLKRIDEYYSDQRGSESEGVATQLARQLADPRPADVRTIKQLRHYKGLDARWADWRNVADVCRSVAVEMVQ